MIFDCIESGWSTSTTNIKNIEGSGDGKATEFKTEKKKKDSIQLFTINESFSWKMDGKWHRLNQLCKKKP